MRGFLLPSACAAAPTAAQGHGSVLTSASQNLSHGSNGNCAEERNPHVSETYGVGLEQDGAGDSGGSAFALTRFLNSTGFGLGRRFDWSRPVESRRARTPAERRTRSRGQREDSERPARRQTARHTGSQSREKSGYRIRRVRGDSTVSAVFTGVLISGSVRWNPPSFRRERIVASMRERPRTPTQNTDTEQRYRTAIYLMHDMHRGTSSVTLMHTPS